MPRRFVLLLWLTLACASSEASVPAPRLWAVIVGVSEYPTLEPELQLEGPRNDVPLVLNWLQRTRAVPRSQVTVLADQVAQADGLPTRSAILEALNALPQRTVSGDTVFLYFAGHGSRQPQPGQSWTKADGLDEIFLPRDVGRWAEGQHGVAGAIIGSEIGRVVDALRAQGVFVWLVFDSCHSATGARAIVSTQIRSRGVAPGKLGAPDRALAVTDSMPPFQLVRVSNRHLAGGYVAFYAAQGAQTAPELPLPAGATDRQVHGLFTFALLKGLAQVHAGSYRDVAHRILADYSITYRDTTPEFEGALDEPIHAGAAAGLHDSWPVTRDMDGTFHLYAGRLAGLAPGSLLGLHSLSTTNSRAVGVLRLTRVGLSESWASAVSDAATLRRWHVPKDQSNALGAGIVELLEAQWDLKVGIAQIRYCGSATASPVPCPLYDASVPAAAAQSYRRLVEHTTRPAGLEWVTDPAAADLIILALEDRVCLARPGAVLQSIDRSACIDPDAPSASEQLRVAWLRATRAVALRKVAAEFPGQLGGLKFDLEPRVAGLRYAPGEERRLRLPQGSELDLRLQNLGSEDLDVTILSIDDHFKIDACFPVDRETNRLPPHSAPVEVHGWAGTPGSYDLVVISQLARPGQPHDLGYLAQPGVGERGGPGDNLGNLFARVGFDRPSARGFSTAEDERTSAIELISYDVY
jgi:hypothetical protein